jgi:hypothetical protein
MEPFSPQDNISHSVLSTQKINAGFDQLAQVRSLDFGFASMVQKPLLSPYYSKALGLS